MFPLTDALETIPYMQRIGPSWPSTHNRLAGTIIAYCHDQDRGYRICTVDKGVVDLTLSPETYDLIHLDRGLHVILNISPADVMLSPPRWIDPTEANYWPGRVVFASPPNPEPLVIVKIIGQPWTLMSSQTVSWLNRPACAWDRVTVHIPPDAIRIIRQYPGHPHLRPRLLTPVTCRDEQSLPTRSE